MLVFWGKSGVLFSCSNRFQELTYCLLPTKGHFQNICTQDLFNPFIVRIISILTFILFNSHVSKPCCPAMTQTSGRSSVIFSIIPKKNEILLTSFMYNVDKWPNILLKSCGIHTARFLMYFWLFFNIMYEGLDGAVLFERANKKN